MARTYITRQHDELYGCPKDREHRFAEGDLVKHKDDLPDAAPMVVEACTWRIVAGMAYPTYTLIGRVYGMDDTVDDVLCTLDLVEA